MNVTVVTVSDRASRGEYEDRSGPRIVELVTASHPAAAVTRVVVPDEVVEIEAALAHARDAGSDWIITTGGTGVGPRDVTVEATRRVIETELPGIAEAIRAASLAETATAVLSRGIAGVTGRSFIVNLPGSVGGVETGMRIVAPIMAHALAMVDGAGH
jgi:molybdenum cofactor synthesis domain-containing protein